VAEAASLINARDPLILTVDNGGTNTRVALSSQIDRAIAYPTPHDYDEAISTIGDVADEILDGRKPDAVGFSIACTVEDGHKIVDAGELKKHGWIGRPGPSFGQSIAGRLGISLERVVLFNDCAAGANAERVGRKLRIGQMGAFMVLSTGYGGSLYTAQEIIPDQPGHYFLKPGARCGDGAEGHIEAHIGGGNIKSKFGVSAKDLPHDDPRWREIKDDFHDGMALTLERYQRDYNTPVSVIGFTGSVALGGPNMLSDLQTEMTARFGWHAPRIEEAIYRGESGLYGAAFAADDLLKAA